MRDWRYKDFYIKHLLLPLMAFAVVIYLVAVTGTDLAISSIFFHWEGGSWSLRNYWLLEDVLHNDARNLMVGVLVLVLIAWGLSFVLDKMRPYRWPLGYLLVSAIVSVTLVSLGKTLTNIDCPWSLQMFGGDHPYISLFSHRPDWLGSSRCFPAGHASAGYAWLGLYFLGYHYCPRWRWVLLALVILVGELFGVTQQLRGAHFLSHDIWTFAISWFSAALAYCGLLAGKPQRIATTNAQPSYNSILS